MKSIKMGRLEDLEKNGWLYPTDEFGKLEKGVVYDESETSERVIIDLYALK